MWTFPVYNYTEKKPFLFTIQNIFSGHYLEAFEKFIHYYSPDVIVPPATSYPNLKPKNERICRFCGKTADEVSFRKDAHVIPQCVGNKYLIHDIECDVCNSLFGKYETSFADSIGVFRTADNIKGQRGVPKFKSSGLSIISQKDDLGNNVVLIESSSSERAQYDEKEDALNFTAIKTSYTPLYVMKTLFKIAYSIVGDEELPEYAHIHKIINTNVLDDKLSQYCTVLKFTFSHPVEAPFMITYKKKPEYDTHNIPTKMVVFHFGRFMYEFALLNSKDRFMIEKGGQGTVINVPPYWDTTQSVPLAHKVDFSSHEIRKGEMETFKFTFDKKNREE